MIGSDLLRFSDVKIAVADSETSGLNLLNETLPFQFSWVITQKGRILERHNHYLKWPNFKMSADAARITRFQQSWVDNGEDPRAAFDIWNQTATNPNILLSGHNLLGYDMPIHQLWRRQLGMKPDWSMLPRILDTHLLSKAYKMGIKPDRANLLAWQFKMTGVWDKTIKTSLGVMAKELGIPVDEARQHDGLYDIELTSAVLWKLINLMEI